ncbi:TPA: hypothetical protein DEF17_06115 [bacterium]|nr:MAG: hypothetical protein AUJ18_01400 [Candidatus Hydrogenedentes bacterium CG1_02_42_14]PIU47538.1 MAG: hypothetical protein COS94_06860 [Candidatus Hydrogenedentes bacterium CG07_land_8_20_14_0_80_42_17]HBW47491.1 hypothetical protein [bacterium]
MGSNRIFSIFVSISSALLIVLAVSIFAVRLHTNSVSIQNKVSEDVKVRVKILLDNVWLEKDFKGELHVGDIVSSLRSEQIGTILSFDTRSVTARLDLKNSNTVLKPGAQIKLMGDSAVISGTILNVEQDF